MEVEEEDKGPEPFQQTISILLLVLVSSNFAVQGGVDGWKKCVTRKLLCISSMGQGNRQRWVDLQSLGRLRKDPV